MSKTLSNSINKLEHEVLIKLLKGDDPVLSALRSQFTMARYRNRENTGAGFYLEFDLPKDTVSIEGRPSFHIGDVIAEVDGLEAGAGFVLFIEDGLLSMLEGYAYDEPWPENIEHFDVKYSSGQNRNIDALRASADWPKL